MDDMRLIHERRGAPEQVRKVGGPLAGKHWPIGGGFDAAGLPADCSLAIRYPASGPGVRGTECNSNQGIGAEDGVACKTSDRGARQLQSDGPSFQVAATPLISASPKSRQCVGGGRNQGLASGRD
jgi:hypothetical protein